MCHNLTDSVNVTNYNIADSLNLELGIKNDDLNCEICYKGKMTRTLFPKKSESK